MKKSRTNLGPNCMGAILPREFLRIQYNQMLTKRCFKSREDVSSSMGISPILDEPVHSCYVETDRFKVMTL